MNKLERSILGYEAEFGFLKIKTASYKQSEECDKIIEAGDKLPEGIIRYEDEEGVEYFSIEDFGYSEEEKKKLLLYQQASNIKTIKNWVVFFGVLSAASLCGGIIAAIIRLL